MTKKNLTFILGIILILAPAGSTCAAEEPVAQKPSIHGENVLLGAENRTGGGVGKAAIHPGHLLTEEFKLNFDLPLEDEWNCTTNVHLRKSDDPQISIRRDFRLLGYTTDIYNKLLRFTVGDLFGDLSQYTMTQPLDGLQAVVKTESAEIKTVAGISQREDEGGIFRRYALGQRAELLLVKEYGPVKDFAAGFNIASSYDDPKSIVNINAVPASSNLVGSISSRALLFDMTQFDLELAKSYLAVDQDTSQSSYTDKVLGDAVRLNTTTKISKKAKFRFGYDWVTAGFNTLSGSAVPDRSNLTSRLDYRFNTEWASEFGYRMSFDRLSKSSLDKRTFTHVPRVALNWTPANSIFFLNDIYSRWYWEMRSRVAEDAPSGQTHFTANEVGVDNDFRASRVNFNLGGNIRTEDDRLNKVNGRVFYTAYMGARMNENISMVSVSPSLRWQFTYDDKLKEGGRDFVQSVIESLALDIPNIARFEQRFSVETASRLAYDSDTAKFNIYCGLDYRINKTDDNILRLSYERTDFLHPSSLERFKETSFQAKLINRF